MKVLPIAITVAAMLTWKAEAQIYDTNNVSVQTIAGSAFVGYLDGVGQATMFNGPQKIAADSLGNLFVWDSGNGRIRKIDTNLVVTTFAGGGSSLIPANGTNANLSNYDFWAFFTGPSNKIYAPGYSAQFAQIRPVVIAPNGDISYLVLTNIGDSSGICSDSAGNLYYTGANKVYRALANGTQETFVGSGNSGGIDGNGVFTSFSNPTQLACDVADNIYVWDGGNRIRRINQNRDVVTMVTSGATGDGLTPHFDNVRVMFFVGGDLIIGNNTSLRRLAVSTNATTIAGSFSVSGYTNGVGNLARFSGAVGACYMNGSFYIADANNERIRQISFNAQTQVLSGANLNLGAYAGLNITGFVGRTYQVQSSPDNSNWTTRATLLLNSSPYLWIDQNPVSENKFYRVLLPP